MHAYCLFLVDHRENSELASFAGADKTRNTRTGPVEFEKVRTKSKGTKGKA